MPKRDPYRGKDLTAREKLEDMVERTRERRRRNQWVCWCGNIAEADILNGFDADGWSSVMVCPICKRNMQRRKDNLWE